ncbi:hypothetical protein MKX03_010779 [Papaver bracteatum]|nr:hypothetical protein MKX03_010779 [Papaver bracteatum]
MGNTIIPPHLLDNPTSPSPKTPVKVVKHVTISDEFTSSASASSSSPSSSISSCVAVVGDGAVGKTCMILRFTRDEFPTEYIPTRVFGNYKTTVIVEGTTININLLDAAGEQDFNASKHMMYRESDVFLVAFSLVNRASYENVLKEVHS